VKKEKKEVNQEPTGYYAPINIDELFSLHFWQENPDKYVCTLTEDEVKELWVVMKRINLQLKQFRFVAMSLHIDSARLKGVKSDD
jgi:hypothetical protein